MLEKIRQLQKEKEEQEEQKKLLESGLSQEDIEKKFNEKIKEQQEKIKQLESLQKNQKDVLDGQKRDDIPDVKRDANNEELLRMLATFMSQM